MNEFAKGFRDLIVYNKAYNLALELFKESLTFPKEEKYSLTDQVRRSSRSITTNIAEAWAKRRYPKSFINKLTDSLGEEYETEVWLDYTKDFKYITEERHKDLMSHCDEIRKLLTAMINNSDKWCTTNPK